MFVQHYWLHIFQQLFAKQIPKFVKALERSNADPDGIFFNNYLEKIFYPDGHPSKHR